MVIRRPVLPWRGFEGLQHLEQVSDNLFKSQFSIWDDLLQKRRFGKTGLQVSSIGFGGTWISQLSMDEAVKVVQRAFELGINYFDTAKLDGNSEQKIGTLTNHKFF